MKYFTIDEFTYSSDANEYNIDNSPTDEHKENIIEFIETVLDPMREAWAEYCDLNNLGSPGIIISSGYRSEQLNNIIPGSSKTSAHSIGCAADLVPVNKHMKSFKKFVWIWLISTHTKFDQVISEHEDDTRTPQWVHIGYKNRHGKQRGQYMYEKNGKYFYLPFHHKLK